MRSTAVQERCKGPPCARESQGRPLTAQAYGAASGPLAFDERGSPLALTLDFDLIVAWHARWHSIVAQSTTAVALGVPSRPTLRAPRRLRAAEAESPYAAVVDADGQLGPAERISDVELTPDELLGRPLSPVPIALAARYRRRYAAWVDDHTWKLRVSSSPSP